VKPDVPWDPAEFTVPPEDGKVRFHDLNLPVEVMHAIYDLGFQYCTPIQSGILNHTLSGADATGRAQTGTGKTAAFLITILTHFSRNPPLKGRKRGTPRALILAPTRELVLQIEKDAKSLARYTDCNAIAVFGGMEYGKQQQLLKEGYIDIVAATPGRLLDFKRKGNIDLSRVEILVIDEADRMLDMGFIPDVRRIIESTPMKGKRQTMFFSATLTPEVNRLAAAWTREAVQIDVTPPQDITLASIDQVLYITTDEEKFTLLFNLITKRNLERVMVFANRRDETQFLKDLLTSRGIHCGLLSGDVSQEQRVRTLEAFRGGRIKVLVATDVAARGLHIEGVSHVVNFSLPLDPQDYLHRIGRTGRAGASGISVSFATETEAYQIPEIETFIGRTLPATHPEPDLLTELPALADGVAEPRKRPSRPQRGGGPRGRPGAGRGSRGPGRRK
jgi:ATP-dependent RNA helicase RhlB